MKAELPALAARLACTRLAQSRERLQQTLPTEPATLARTTKKNFGKRVVDRLNGVRSTQGFNLATDLAKVWWAKHPYRLTAIMVRDVASAAVLPTAQRHPAALVAGAFLVGGLLAWSRPWRWFPLKTVLSTAASSTTMTSNPSPPLGP